MSLMNDVFKKYLDEFTCVYLDDILLYSNTLNEHTRHLHQAFHKLRSYKQYANLTTCQVAQQAVTYPGHNRSAAGLIRKMRAYRLNI